MGIRIPDGLDSCILLHVNDFGKRAIPFSRRRPTMGGVKRSTPHSSAGPLGLDPAVAGTACCVVSALGYTGSNICMRQLAEGSDLTWSMWAVFNKELITVVAVGPWLLWRALRRLPVFPSRRALIALVLVGLAVQLAANLPVQWAFGKVGLAVVVPAIFGVMLTSSAVLGLVLLGERVTRRSAAAIGLLLFSLALLGLAADSAGKSMKVSDPVVIALGVGAACLAGAIYAVLTITIRRAGKGHTPTSTIVFITTLMGVLSLGLLSLRLLGVEKLLATPPPQLAWMYAAGTLNLIAFLAIAKGLQLTTVVHANVLNASQVAMAALAGMAIFGEPLTVWLATGAGLTVVGVVMIDRPNNGDRDADQHA